MAEGARIEDKDVSDKNESTMGWNIQVGTGEGVLGHRSGGIERSRRGAPPYRSSEFESSLVRSSKRDNLRA